MRAEAVPDRLRSDAAAQITKSQVIYIKGKAYDVSAWSKQHPGGSLVFEHWVGKDATEPFTAFHPPTVRDRLISLEVPSDQAHSSNSNANSGSYPMASMRFQQLTAKLRQDGLFETSWTFYFTTFLWAAALWMLGAWAVSHGRIVPAALSIALFWQQAGVPHAECLCHNLLCNSGFHIPNPCKRPCSMPLATSCSVS